MYAHTHSTLYTLNRVSIHTLAALHPGVLEKAIALHYSHASPKGKRSALVFGRRASVEQFRRQSDMYGGGGEGQKPGMSLGQSTIEKNYLDIPVDEATTGLPSPAGRNVVALDVHVVHQKKKTQQQLSLKQIRLVEWKNQHRSNQTKVIDRHNVDTVPACLVWNFVCN